MLRFALTLLFGGWAFLSHAQTTLYSQFSGNWNDTDAWNTEPDGSGTYFSDPNASTFDIVVQSGHQISLHNTRALGNLSVESGGGLEAAGTGLKYLEIYGSSVQIDGMAGSAGDELSFDVNGPSCTISGSGSAELARLRKDNDPGSASTTNLSIDLDLTLNYNSDSRTAFCNQAIGKNLNVEIEAGRTVYLPFGNVCIDGNDGSNSVNHGGAITVYGILEMAGNDGHLYLKTDNSAAFPVQFTVAGGGQVIVGGGVYGNSAGGPATATLTVQNNGTLTLNGAVQNWSTSKNSINLNSNSLVAYNGYGNQYIEPQWPYANLSVSGSDKFLAGNTNVGGTLTLDGAGILFGFYDLRMAPGGTISGAGPFAYLHTDDTGMLRQTCSNTALWYPVGNSAYNPIRLRNSGASDVIGVRVGDELLTEGYAGNYINSEAVNRSWFLDEDFPGGSQLEAMAQWNASDELTGFNRNNCKMVLFKNGAWNTSGNTGPAQGSNPYTRLRSAVAEPDILAVVSGLTLPVEWLRFEAEVVDGSVWLTWETASEQLNSGFSVEKSKNGAQFYPIGFVYGKGTGSIYHFEDEKPLESIQFYRLKQIDANGDHSLSPVRSVQTAIAEWSVFPNPPLDFLTVTWNSRSEEPVLWRVCNGAGQIIGQGTQSGETRAFKLPVYAYTPGVYTLCLIQGATKSVYAFTR